MYELGFGEILSGLECPLKEKASKMDCILPEEDLDEPIIFFVDIEDDETQDLHGLSDAIDEVYSWIGEINPNYDPYDIDNSYNMNCGACSLAVYQRLEGKMDTMATEENIGSDELMELVLGKKFVSMTPDEIKDYLLEAGNGAHAIIGVDRAFGPGHWFNAANLDGIVVAIDGQSGAISGWPPDYGDVVNWEISI